MKSSDLVDKYKMSVHSTHSWSYVDSNSSYTPASGYTEQAQKLMAETLLFDANPKQAYDRMIQSDSANYYDRKAEIQKRIHKR